MEPGEKPADRPHASQILAFSSLNLPRSPAHEFTVVIERDEDPRFVAICPALQGCYTEGETEAEARDLIQDAIRLHVEALCIAQLHED